MPGAHKSEGASPTSVVISGRTYHLRGGGDPTYLAELAEMVDGKMREIESATGTADTLKVAILASLNIADEYFQASRGIAPPKRGRSKRTGEANEKRLAKLVTALDEVLAE